MTATTRQTLLSRFIPSDRKTTIAFITDGEPDDWMALLALLKHIRGESHHLTIIMSAWQKQRPKAARLYSFLKEKFPDMLEHQIEIKLGEPSNTKYEMVLTPEEENMVFEFYDFNDLKVDVIFQLTHPTEIWKVFIDDLVNFSTTSLFTYGSFNYRGPVNDGIMTPDDVLQLFNAFKYTLYYEAFTNTNPTTMEYDDLSELMQQNYPQIADLIRWWNSNIYTQCQETLSTSTDVRELDRCLKIVASINRYPLQFLDADGGLMATLLSSESHYCVDKLVYPHPKEGYPHFVDYTNNKSGIMVHHPEVIDLKANHVSHHQFYVKLLSEEQ